MIAFEDFNKLIGLPEIRKIEQNYTTDRVEAVLKEDKIIKGESDYVKIL